MRFSQRHGLTPIKSVIQVDAMDDELRNGLWNAFFSIYVEYVNSGYYPFNYSEAAKLVRKIWRDFYKEAVDTIPEYFPEIRERMRKRFYSAEWYKVYDFIEFIADNTPERKSHDFINACNSVLEKEVSAYRFVGGQLTKITSEQEIIAIEEALRSTEPLVTVKEHLKTALSLLSDRKSPDYRNSIKESISAVESLSNLISGAKSTLGQALKVVETKVALHPALKNSFDSLYGYTNDASGIRHALLDEPNLNFEDAKFMLVSCSGFVNYLIAKAAKAGITLS